MQLIVQGKYGEAEREKERQKNIKLDPGNEETKQNETTGKAGGKQVNWHCYKYAKSKSEHAVMNGAKKITKI